MKKIFTIAAIACTAMSFAISANAQISVGAGYGLATHTSKTVILDKTTKEEPTNLSGLYVNGSYDWNFLSKSWGDLSLQPGLTYSFYSDKLEVVESEGEKDRTFMREHYLDIPVNVKYSYNLLPGTLKLSAYAGPAFSFGLSSALVNKYKSGDDWTTSRVNLYNGNTVSKGKIDGEPFKESAKGEEKTGYGMFDIKIGVGIVATVVEKIDIKVGYNFGLLNRTAKMSASDEAKYISHTNILQIGVGYNF